MVQKSYVSHLEKNELRLQIFCCGSNTGWEDEVTEKFLSAPGVCSVSAARRCELNTFHRKLDEWCGNHQGRFADESGSVWPKQNDVHVICWKWIECRSRQIPDFFAVPGCRCLQLSMRVALFTMCCTWDSYGAEKSVSFGHWWWRVPCSCHISYGSWEKVHGGPWSICCLLPCSSSETAAEMPQRHAPTWGCFRLSHYVSAIKSVWWYFFRDFQIWINLESYHRFTSTTSPISTVTFLDRFHLKTSTHPAPCVGGCVPSMSFPLPPRLRRRLTDFEVTKEASKRWGFDDGTGHDPRILCL